MLFYAATMAVDTAVVADMYTSKYEIVSKVKKKKKKKRNQLMSELIDKDYRTIPKLQSI